jgi:hypothetical protein
MCRLPAWHHRRPLPVLGSSEHRMGFCLRAETDLSVRPGSESAGGRSRLHCQESEPCPVRRADRERIDVGCGTPEPEGISAESAPVKRKRPAPSQEASRQRLSQSGRSQSEIGASCRASADTNLGLGNPDRVTQLTGTTRGYLTADLLALLGVTSDDRGPTCRVSGACCGRQRSLQRDSPEVPVGLTFDRPCLRAGSMAWR